MKGKYAYQILPMENIAFGQRTVWGIFYNLETYSCRNMRLKLSFINLPRIAGKDYAYEKYFKLISVSSFLISTTFAINAINVIYSYHV